VCASLCVCVLTNGNMGNKKKAGGGGGGGAAGAGKAQQGSQQHAQQHTQQGSQQKQLQQGQLKPTASANSSSSAAASSSTAQTVAGAGTNGLSNKPQAMNKGAASAPTPGNSSKKPAVFAAASKQVRKQADALVDKGIKLLDDDKQAEAKVLFEKALGLVPNHQNAHYNIVALEVEDLDDELEYTEANFDTMITRTRRAIGKFDDVIKLDTSNRGEITGLAHRAKASSLYHNWINLLTKHTELFPGRKPCGNIDVKTSIEQAFVDGCRHYDIAITILDGCSDLDECLYEKAQHLKRFAIYLRYQYESEAKSQSASSALVQHEEFLPEKFSKLLELWVAASNAYCTALQTEFSSGIDSQIILSHGECLQTFWDFFFSCPAFKQFLLLPPSQPSSSSATTSPLTRFITMYLSESGREDINLETLRKRTESICSLIVNMCAAEWNNHQHYNSVATLVACDLKQCLLKLSVVDSSYSNNPIATVKFLCELLVERTDTLSHIMDELLEKELITEKVSQSGTSETAAMASSSFASNALAKQTANTSNQKLKQSGDDSDDEDDFDDENEVTLEENLGILGDAYCDISMIFPVLYGDFVKSNRSQQVSDQFEGMMLKTISHIGKAIARARKYCEIDWDIDTIDVDHLPAEATDAAVANEPSESDTVSKCSSSHADILDVCRQHTLMIGRCSLCISMQLIEQNIRESAGNPLELAENQGFLRENAFNLACVCWQLGDKGGCRKAIECIHDLKNELVMELLNDSDLAGIAEEPWFAELMHGVDGATCSSGTDDSAGDA
jgi:hypothetical protein